MPLSTWLALAFLLVVAVVGTAVTARRALTLWRTLRSYRRIVGRGLEDVGRRASAVEARLAAAGESASRLDASVTRLRSSRARAAVLARALAETRSSIARARELAPRK